MSVLNSPIEMYKWLNSLQENDTFVFEYDKNLKIKRYATVIENPEGKNYYDSTLGEPYNILLEVKSRKNPSADYYEERSISHDPEKEKVYLKKGVGRFTEILSIYKDPLDVNYKSDNQLFARCNECGTKTKLNIEENNQIRVRRMKKNKDNELITPCCYSQ